MMIRNRLRCFVPMRPADGDGGDLGGGAPAVVDVGAAPAAPDAQPAAAAPVAPAAPAAPTTMLEAMNQVLQPRDELGRFTFKDANGNAVDAQGNLAPAGTAAAPGAPVVPAAAAPAAPAAPAVPEDPLKMPEGLGEKAQQRFRDLANGIKDRDAQLEQAQQSITYVQTQFQEHQVQQPQFEQAMQVIGMINRQDFAGAQRVLMEQLQQLALLSGQSPGAVDPLANFPDLRQRVDTLQISEADAMQLAGLQFRQGLQGQAQQRQMQAQQQQREQEQAQQVQQQAVDKGLLDIDAFCKQMQATDMDYAVIEQRLEPALKQLLPMTPPSQWAALVKSQYELIKNTASGVRQTMAQPAGQVLRPTGQASPSVAPKSLYEAMWGKPTTA